MVGVLDRGNVFPPMNLLGLGSVLRAEGHTVAVADQLIDNATGEELLSIIAREAPDVVGFTSMTYDIQSVNEEISLIKNRFPEIITVLGGTHVTSLAKRTLEENADIDIAVVGEGERVAGSIFDRLKSGGSLNDVRGNAFRHDLCDFMRGRPDVFQVDVIAILVLAKRLLGDVDLHRAGQCVGDNERW